MKTSLTHIAGENFEHAYDAFGVVGSFDEYGPWQFAHAIDIGLLNGRVEPSSRTIGHLKASPVGSDATPPEQASQTVILEAPIRRKRNGLDAR